MYLYTRRVRENAGRSLLWPQPQNFPRAARWLRAAREGRGAARPWRRLPLASRMLIPAFKLQLNNPILKGLVDVGKYDGEHPSLTCATTAGKIFFHTPHDKSGQNEVKFLNINRKISALTCGRLATKHQRDLLFVGAQTTLLAYDVQENCDLFFKDAPDGANAILVGKLGDLEAPLALVGGNCSIQGYDHEGNEAFWTVTGQP